MPPLLQFYWLSVIAATSAFNVSVKGFGPPRHFVPASRDLSSELEHVASKFRLLSWNILAPTWDNLGVKESNWQARFARIVQEIRLRRPDVMVLQEVEVLIYDEQVQPFMKARGYQGVYTGIDAGIGLAVFWRTSKFALSTATDFDLTTTALTPWRSLFNEDFNKEQRETWRCQPSAFAFHLTSSNGHSGHKCWDGGHISITTWSWNGFFMFSPQTAWTTKGVLLRFRHRKGWLPPKFRARVLDSLQAPTLPCPGWGRGCVATARRGLLRFRAHLLWCRAHFSDLLIVLFLAGALFWISWQVSDFVSAAQRTTSLQKRSRQLQAGLC